MKLLMPLGLLGLLGLIILLVIYLIKPNYQKKSVSSTYIWKLSLKFRKRRNPVNRMRELILLLCQILAIFSLAFIMSGPIIEAFKPAPVDQRILIIDGSASMLADVEGETRFDRAVAKVRGEAETVAANGGEVTVIVAGQNAEYVSVRTTGVTVSELLSELDAMEGKSKDYCCDGAADYDGAVTLAEQVLAVTPLAKVKYYSDKEYIDHGDVEVEDVSDPTDFNVAILDSVAVLNENYYDFTVEIASYGRASDIMLYCEVNGANDTETTVTLQMPVWLESDVPQTVVLNAESTGQEGIFSYEDARIYIVEEDSFDKDNYFYIYGGTKEKIKIQYISVIPNSYFLGTLRSLRSTLRTRWDIEITEVNPARSDPETNGYDFYIFERSAPATMPNDGVVMFVNPPEVPVGLGITLSGQVASGIFGMFPMSENAILDGLHPERVFVSEYRVATVNEDYDVLLGCYRGDPVYAVKNDYAQKIVLMTFELQNSDLPIWPEFPRLIYRTFNYFFPSTLTRYNFEVGEQVVLNARSKSLHVKGGNTDIILEEFPATVALDKSGSYKLDQTLFNGKYVEESLYVKIPRSESDFSAAEESLKNPYVETVPEDDDYDLLIYFAGALILLLFAEWILHNLIQ